MNQQKIQRNRGMTYIELIVVLGIFAILSTVSIFNYGKFQGKVDIKNLASEIALKIVEAQKNSISGKFNTNFLAGKKPSYGVYFDISNTPTKFVYFSDLDNSGTCNDSNCVAPNYLLGGEVTDIVNITRGNSISSLTPTGSGCLGNVSNLTIVFKRPKTAPTITTSTAGCVVSDVLINLTSPKAVNGMIRVYPSGRIQLN